MAAKNLIVRLYWPDGSVFRAESATEFSLSAEKRYLSYTRAGDGKKVAMALGVGVTAEVEWEQSRDAR